MLLLSGKFKIPTQPARLDAKVGTAQPAEGEGAKGEIVGGRMFSTNLHATSALKTTNIFILEKQPQPLHKRKRTCGEFWREKQRIFYEKTSARQAPRH